MMTGVPRVYEKLQARIIGERAGRSRGSSARSSAGRSAPGHARGARAAARPPPRPARRAAGVGRRPPGVLEDPRRRSAAACATSCRAARRCRSTIAEFFHGVGLPIIEGYGLTETAPILTVNPPGAPRAGTRRPRHRRRRAAHRRGRRDPRARAERHGAATTTSRRRPPKPSRTAGSTPATSARSTPTATCRSPIARRTCSSPRAARRSRRSRSRAILKRSPLVAEAVLLGDRRRYAAALIVPDFAALERRLQGPRPPAGVRAPSSRRVPTCWRSTRRSSTPSTATCRSSSASRSSRCCRRVLDRIRRADADAEGEAQGRRRALAETDRSVCTPKRRQSPTDSRTPTTSTKTISPCSCTVGSVLRRRRLDVDDGVRDLRELLHQPILDDVRQAVGFVERRVAAEPDVQIEERVIGRAARADLMAADDFRHGHHHAPDVLLVHARRDPTDA